MNNRFFTILWVSFAMMLALIVSIIAYDFCLEDEGELGVLQEERIAEKKRRRMRQVGRIGSAAQSVDAEAQIVEDVIQECDNEPLKIESEIVYDAREKLFEGLVKLQNEGNRPTTKQVADFKAAFER